MLIPNVSNYNNSPAFFIGLFTELGFWNGSYNVGMKGAQTEELSSMLGKSARQIQNYYLEEKGRGRPSYAVQFLLEAYLLNKNGHTDQLYVKPDILKHSADPLYFKKLMNLTNIKTERLSNITNISVRQLNNYASPKSNSRTTYEAEFLMETLVMHFSGDKLPEKPAKKKLEKDEKMADSAIDIFNQAGFRINS